MKNKNFEDFDLLIERFEESWRAKIITSPKGEATNKFKLPPSIQTSQNLSKHISGKAREIAFEENAFSDAAIFKTTGSELFKAVFDKNVGKIFRSSVEAAQKERVELRLRLRLGNDPEIHNQPWEYLYDADGRGFVALSGIPIIRYVELAQPISNLEITPPLQVLVVVSNPKDVPALNVDKEWEALQDAVQELEKKNLLKLTRLKKPTLEALGTELDLNKAGNHYHILHFIGHGNFDKESGKVI